MQGGGGRGEVIMEKNAKQVELWTIEIKEETSIQLKSFKSSPLDSEKCCSREGNILHMSSIRWKIFHKTLWNSSTDYITPAGPLQIEEFSQDLFDLKQVFCR